MSPVLLIASRCLVGLISGLVGSAGPLGVAIFLYVAILLAVIAVYSLFEGKKPR